MGLERRQVSAFGFYWRRGSPLYPKTGSYIVYGQSRVYVISQQRSQENSAAGGGIGHESFLQSGSIVSVSLAFAKAGRLFSEVTTLDRWRTFQVTTRVEVLKTSGKTRVWVPAALISETPFQKTLANTFSCKSRREIGSQQLPVFDAGTGSSTAYATY